MSIGSSGWQLSFCLLSDVYASAFRSQHRLRCRSIFVPDLAAIRRARETAMVVIFSHPPRFSSIGFTRIIIEHGSGNASQNEMAAVAHFSLGGRRTITKQSFCPHWFSSLFCQPTDKPPREWALIHNLRQEA